MVTATNVADPASHLLGDAAGALTFRVRSPEYNGRILRIRSPKCVIGSDPSCTLRLRAVGVRPFHCLILCGTEGMFIRRWSAGTCLNGAGFTDARLKPGDQLDIGPIELEVLELSRMVDSNAPTEPNTCSPPADSLPAAGATLDKATDAFQDVVPPEHDSHQKGCQQCRQEREELETVLALRVVQGDQERGALAEKYLQLAGDLTRAEAVREGLLEDTERQADQLHEPGTDYRDSIDELRQDLASLRQRHDAQLSEQASLVAEAAEATERVALLEVKLCELKQQVKDARSQADKIAEQRAAQRDEYEQQLAAARAELLQEQRNGRTQSSEWETTCRQLSEQLQQVRQQLDDATSQLEASRQQSVALETELQELRQPQESPADSQEHVAGLVLPREEELAALQREFAEQRQQWEADEQQLREELQEASGRWQEAIGNHAVAESRVTQLESLLEEASQKLAGIAETGQSAQRQREESVAELSKWREVVNSLRHELQQEREQHQCARNEWHADRESIQRELAERSSSLEQLQMKNTQEMQEAEFLIHSLQQEGKQLLSQLDEAKQVIRKDIERHKNTETPRNSAPPSKDKLSPQCQTTLIPARLPGRGRLEKGSPAVQPAATSGASEFGGADELAANHTVLMSPAEFVRRGRGDEPADAPAAAPLVEAATDEEPAAPEPNRAACTGEVPPLEEPVAVEPVVEERAPDQEVIDQRTMVLDADALSSSAIARVEETQAEQQATQSPMEQAWSMLASAPAEPDPNDEEGAIQRYMERLLKRVASQGREAVDEPAVLTRQQPAQRPRDAVAAAPFTQAPVVNAVASAEKEPFQGGDNVSEAANIAAEETPLSTDSRPSTPEMATDLLAMRQLANHSARQAIHSSDQRRFLTVAVGELLVAAVCLASSCFVIVMSPKTLNGQSVGGAIGFSFGCSMFVRGIGKLLNSLSLKRSVPTDSDSDGESEL